MRDLILEAVKGREFELAVRYCGLSEGIGKEHRQPCPFCEGETRFRFIAEPRNCDYALFVCRQCGRGGSILNLLIATNGITYQKAIETLAYEAGVVLPEWTPKTQRAQTRAIWEANKGEDRMTIACLFLWYLNLPFDGVDFRTTDMETIRKYAANIVEDKFDDLIQTLAAWRCNDDRREAMLVLECLYYGKDLHKELAWHRVNKSIHEIRMFAAKERWQLEKEIETELEKLTPNKERRMVG